MGLVSEIDRRTVHPGVLKAAAAKQESGVPSRRCVQLGWSNFVEAFS